MCGLKYQTKKFQEVCDEKSSFFVDFWLVLDFGNFC